MLVKSKVLENRILTSLFFIVCLFIFSERLPTIYSQLPQSSLRADEIKLWLTPSLVIVCTQATAKLPVQTLKREHQ